MPGARRSPFPHPPDLPAAFAGSSSRLRSGDEWDGVHAGADVEIDGHIDDVVADLQLRESVWTGGQLVGRRFTGLECQDVRFERCDLAGAVLQDATFVRVVFRSCRMNGAILAGATLREVAFVDCAIDLADFRMAQLRRSSFEQSQLREADFYGCGLTDVRLSTCDLSRANFDAVRVERVDLRGSTIDSLRGPASLSSARFDRDQVIPLGAALVGSLGFVID